MDLQYVKNIYTIIFKAKELIYTYEQEKKKMQDSINKNIEIDTLMNIFYSNDIFEIERKLIVLKALLNEYVRCANDKERNSFIPKLERIANNSGYSLEACKEALMDIAIDFVVQNLDEYKKNIYKQKYIADAFRVHVKMLSNNLVNKNIKLKTIHDKDVYQLAIHEYLAGGSLKKISKKYSISRHTIYNKAKQIIRDENLFNNNSKDLEDIDHNLIIKKLGNIAIQEGYEVYSEHDENFNADIGKKFNRMDLIGKKNDEIMFAVEIENLNDIKKSLYNLQYHYNECPLTILFVIAKKLSFAQEIRSENDNYRNIKIIKLGEGYERVFKSLIN